MSDGTSVMEGVVPAEASGQRLDKVLTGLFPPYSRSQLQQWTKQGRITICGRVPEGREPVRGGEQVRLEVPPVEPRFKGLDIVQRQGLGCLRSATEPVSYTHLTLPTNRAV